MIGREFVKHLRLRHGRTETIRTRFELKGGELVEHITLETHDRPTQQYCDRVRPTSARRADSV